jgi:NAD kinase
MAIILYPKQHVYTFYTAIQIMNEVTVHRGRNVQLAGIECYVENEFLTDAVVSLR